MKTPCRSPVAVAVAACLFCSAAAQAGVSVHAMDCTGCNAAQLEALVPNCEQGSRLITDFDAGRLYQGCYDIKGVQRRVVTHTGPVTLTNKIYHWTQPPAYMQNTFQAYLDVYNNNGHVRQAEAKAFVHVDLKPVHGYGDDGYMNAYDTVRWSGNNDAVVNWLQTTNFTAENIQGAMISPPDSPALDAVLARLFNTIKTSILTVDFKNQITVVFHDGSERTYTTNSDGNWTEVPGTAKDSHGNPIPDTANAVANNGGTQGYNFSGTGSRYDQGNFLALMWLYGIPVVEGGSGSQRYDCTWQPNTSTLTCRQE